MVALWLPLGRCAVEREYEKTIISNTATSSLLRMKEATGRSSRVGKYRGADCLRTRPASHTFI